MPTTEPKLEYRNVQPYAAIRVQVPIPFGRILPPLWQEVDTWLSEKGTKPAGAAFIRYLTTDMSRKLDIEVGFPVSSGMAGDDRVTTGFLPAGRYATMVYAGPYKGKGLMKATAGLLDWAEKNGVIWQKSEKDGVEWWESRLENYLTNPEEEPDSKKWQTELAFLVANS